MREPEAKAVASKSAMDARIAKNERQGPGEERDSRLSTKKMADKIGQPQQPAPLNSKPTAYTP